MERYTEKFETKYEEIVAREENGVNIKDLDIRRTDSGEVFVFGKAIDRLAEYEETGLTPEMIKEIDEEFSRLAKEFSKVQKEEEILRDKNQRLKEEIERSECEKCSMYYKMMYGCAAAGSRKDREKCRKKPHGKKETM